MVGLMNGMCLARKREAPRCDRADSPPLATRAGPRHDQHVETDFEGARIYKAVPQLARIREQVLLGDVWKHPEMSYRDRILVTCAVLAATGKLEELKVWIVTVASRTASRWMSCAAWWFR